MQINTPKIAQRYDTIYYFRQKYVNWEYIAPLGFNNIIIIPIIDAVKTRQMIVGADLLTEQFPFAFSIVKKYTTQADYNAHSIYYTLTYTHPSPNDRQIIVNHVIDENEYINIYPNITLTTNTPTITNTIKITRSSGILQLFSKTSQNFTFYLTYRRLGASEMDKTLEKKATSLPDLNLIGDVVPTMKLPTGIKNFTYKSEPIRKLNTVSRSALKYTENTKTTIINPKATKTTPHQSNVLNGTYITYGTQQLSDKKEFITAAPTYSMLNKKINILSFVTRT